MAVLVTWIKKFIGTSTEDKPLLEIPAGSRFLETDTGAVYIFSGSGWIELTTDRF